MDAGFLNVVEIGLYYMTKDTTDFSQFHAVACREYTLPMMDPWKHNDWARVRSCNLLLAR